MKAEDVADKIVESVKPGGENSVWSLQTVIARALAETHRQAQREAYERADDFAKEVEKLAFEMPPPNEFTPRFVQLVSTFRRGLVERED